MCTVSYLPLPSGGFILTSNRDERSSRPDALVPTSYSSNGVSITYPKDPLRGGTWIAAGENGKVLCLLNGGFKAHVPKEYYSISRGQIIPDYFQYKNVLDFIQQYSFTEIEPFTLIVIEDQQLFEIRWNGTATTLSRPAALEPHIWSSVTLYSEQAIFLRESWFDTWVQSHPYYSSDEIIHFHHFGGEGNPYTNLLMSRENGMGTVSITSVEYSNERMKMYYHDLKNHSSDQKNQNHITEYILV